MSQLYLIVINRNLDENFIKKGFSYFFIFSLFISLSFFLSFLKSNFYWMKINGMRQGRKLKGIQCECVCLWVSVCVYEWECAWVYLYVFISEDFPYLDRPLNITVTVLMLEYHSRLSNHNNCFLLHIRLVL